MSINLNTSIQYLQSTLDCRIYNARTDPQLRSLRLEIANAWRDEQQRANPRSSMLRILRSRFRRVSGLIRMSTDIEESTC